MEGKSRTDDQTQQQPARGGLGATYNDEMSSPDQAQAQVDFDRDPWDRFNTPPLAETAEATEDNYDWEFADHAPVNGIAQKYGEEDELQGYNYDDDDGGDDDAPGYMNPTIASKLPPYMHLENERVRNSYRTGSCWTVRKLPPKLKVGEVNHARKEHVVDNLLSHADKVFKPTSQQRNSAFAQPTYVSADYDKERNLRKLTIDARRVETETLSRKPFLAGSSRIRSKTEDIFYDPEWKYPNLGPGGGNANIAHQLRGDSVGSFEEKFVTETGMIATVKAGPGVKVQEWCRLIHAKLAKDWSQYKFRVKFTASNELLIQFLKPQNSALANNNQQHQQQQQRSLYGSRSAPSRTFGANSTDPGFSPKAAGSSTSANFGNATGATGARPSSSSRPGAGGGATTRNASTTSGTAAAPAAQLGVVFPPPNNLLNKYMQHLSTHGLCNQFGFRRRGDRWNIYETEWAPIPGPQPRAAGTAAADVGDADSDSIDVPNTSSPQPKMPAEMYAQPGHDAAAVGTGDTNGDNYHDNYNNNNDNSTAAAMDSEAERRVSFGVDPNAPAARTEATPTAAGTAGAGPANQPPQRKVVSGLGTFSDDAFETDSFQDNAEKTATSTATARQEKVYYLTYSFYAPWVHSGHLNTTRVYAHRERKKAKKFGHNFRDKYRKPVEITEEKPKPKPAPAAPKVQRKNSMQEAAQMSAMTNFMQGLLLHHG